ncbi:MAG: hypothetical protein HDS50_02535 [Bacteroides sp.]|nr:hypothetical protein [Bacteroides sp.]
MVEIKKDRLVIVIETKYPEEALADLQKGLIDAVGCMHDDFLNHETIFPLVDFMSHIFPSIDQLKKISE